MSNLVSDDLVIVIDFDSSIVRIKQGITDVNVLPNLNIPCSIALPIGEALTNGEGEGNAEGAVNFEDVSTYDLALIGDQLKSVDTTKYKLVNPLESNKLKKIDEFKLFLYLLIVKILKINLATNASALMLILPPKFNKNELELITQFCFESLNTPGLYIINRPMATLYGHGSLSGLVIDIGENSTHVNPIMDNSLPEQTIIDVNIGIKDLEAHWLELFKADTDLNEVLGDKLNNNFVNYFKETILPSLNDAEGETEEDKNKPKEYEYEGLKFTIKDEIFDQMWDALFKPELNSDKCLSLQHSIYNCLQKLDHDRRPLLTDNITFSGSLANVPGLLEKLEFYFQPFLSTSLNAGYTQINKLAFLKMPEYFSNYKGKRELMTILGGMIASKGIFNDYKNYVNKFDYNKLGPVCIHAKIN